MCDGLLKMEKHKGLLLEHLRGQLVNYLKYYKSVYSDSLPIDTAGFKMNYSLDSDSLKSDGYKSDLSPKPMELKIKTQNIMNEND